MFDITMESVKERHEREKARMEERHEREVKNLQICLEVGHDPHWAVIAGEGKYCSRCGCTDRDVDD